MVITVFNSFTNFVVQFRHNENSHDDITKEERWKIIFIHLLYFMMYEETARFNTAMKGNSFISKLGTRKANLLSMFDESRSLTHLILVHLSIKRIYVGSPVASNLS